MDSKPFHYIGMFRQTSDKMIVSDPLYRSYDEPIQCKIRDIKPGKYYCFVKINKDGDKIDKMYVTRKKKFKVTDYSWIKEGTVYADSGKAGIFDYADYKRCDQDQMFEDCTKLINTNENSIKADTLDCGVVSLVSFKPKQDTYNVYINRNKNNKVTAINVVFIKKSDR